MLLKVLLQLILEQLILLFTEVKKSVNIILGYVSSKTNTSILANLIN